VDDFTNQFQDLKWVLRSQRHDRQLGQNSPRTPNLKHGRAGRFRQQPRQILEQQ
jgi:hypothetical protein